jgi:hypothetical protein
MFSGFVQVDTANAINEDFCSTGDEIEGAVSVLFIAGPGRDETGGPCNPVVPPLDLFLQEPAYSDGFQAQIP